MSKLSRLRKRRHHQSNSARRHRAKGEVNWERSDGATKWMSWPASQSDPAWNAHAARIEVQRP